MKGLMLSIHANWLQMILSGVKKLEFRDWKNVPPEKMKELIGMTIYFYCSKAKPLLWDIDDKSGIEFYGERYLIRDKNLPMNDLIYTGHQLNGKVVAKCVVKDVLGHEKENAYRLLHSGMGYAPRVRFSEKIGCIGQQYALELSQVEAIEPKDVTEFVSWSKLEKSIKDSYGVDYNNHDGLEDLYWDVLYEQLDYLKENRERHFKEGNVHLDKRWVHKPPQSRTWIYVEEA